MAEAPNTKVSQERLLTAIAAELRSMPQLPLVTVRVMQLVNQSSTSADDLSRVIAADPGLASQILRLVNSAYYGFPRRVTTITEAIVVLGFNTVKYLVASVAVAQAFAPRGKCALNRENYWAHSLATAVAAKSISRHVGLSTNQADEVFVGGLLHDIGKLFLDQIFPQQYAVTLRVAQTAHLSVLQAEGASLGIQHCHVGKLLAHKWNFPVSLMSMIALHHHPATAKDDFNLVAVVHAADRVAHTLNLVDCPTDAIPALDPDVEKWMRISSKGWDAIERETLEQFQDAKEFLNVTGAKEGRAPAGV
ncbi:MAG TPA: HDOD domain-containing protein [Capsulimonadaceae bacterium]